MIGRIRQHFFLRGLRHATRSFTALAASPKEDESEKSDWEIGRDREGFPTATAYELGKLWGFLFAQAQCDGASSVRLYHSTEKMIYTIAGSDYEMVPPPSPLNADMSKYLLRAARARIGTSGKLRISFADLKIVLQVKHHDTEDSSRFVQISGLTGVARPNEPVLPKSRMAI